jgi:hypothetical protein
MKRLQISRKVIVGSSELEAHDVVIAIDLVTQAGGRLEVVIQLEDFVEIANAGGIDFQFDHVLSEFNQSLQVMQK